ncbi:MAG: hypothetical protein ACRDNT_26020 [Streptosporangiaceae bacterium]
MRKALADKLQAAGLPWAPSAAAVKQHAAEAAEPASGMRALMRNKKLRKDTAYAAAVALLVLLWGGYHQGWKWTGFQENDQLWDWLNLLLLPVVIGTIPLWIQYRKYIGRGRRVVYWTFIVAWTGFVIAGYLIPLTWTGFRGHKLWDWFVLLVIPAALAITMALTGIGLRLPQVLRSLHRYQKAIMVALAVGWIVTVIGGYLLRWSWTGYPGQSLWDWLQLLLVPLLLPTVLLPALLIWVSGNAEERATKAHEAAITRTPTTAAGTSP